MIVVPSLPMSYYLFEIQNKLPADWLINTEVNRQYELFVTLASHPGNFVVVEKSFLTKQEKALPDSEKTSIIAWKIYQDFRPIAETNHFIIYNSLK